MNDNQAGMIVMPESGELRFTPESVNRDLPNLLLTTLERGWYQDFDIAKFPTQKMRGGVDLDSQLGLMQVYEVPYTQRLEESLHLSNMQNVISSVRDGSHTLVYGVMGQGGDVKLMTGVRKFRRDTIYQTDQYVEVLHRALRSNYPGIVLAPQRKALAPEEPYRLIPPQEYQVNIVRNIKQSHYLSCITGIPSLRIPGSPDDFFSQSIDRLVDALRGEDYLLLVLAEPILDDRLSANIAVLRRLSGEVHTLVNQSISLYRNRSETDQTSRSKSQTYSVGAGQILSAIFGISVGMTTTTSEGTSITEGTGASVAQETLDKTAQFCEQVLEHYIQRLQVGRSLGFWNVGIYLASNNFNTQMRSQAIVRSLYSGMETYFEPIRVIDLTDAPAGVRHTIAHLEIPVLTHLGSNTDHPLGDEYQSLGTPLTTNELSLLFSFPHREVPGLKMKRVADFNLNPPPIEKGAIIGSLLYRGEVLPARFAIDSKSLLRHTFVTGLTGSGKTNTCLALLEDAYRNCDLNFMVIDPAKTEYRFLLGSEILGKKIAIFTLGAESLSPFRLNPFEFVRGFPLLTHIDLLKAVFNAAFPMYASMPYLLEDALFKIYKERGWNIADSTNRFIDVNDPGADYTSYLPRLSDLYNKIDEVVASKRYDVRLTLDLTAALKARLGSLLSGYKGLMLDTRQSISIQELLEKPVVIELCNLGDEDEKAFIMALVFILLYEATSLRPIDNQLHHVTLIEEAHRLLRNIPIATSAESANPRGKTVEMFTDMMAEMRARGEGFMIVDQMPGKLVPDVIKGSDLKVVHRLLAHDDRLAVGNAMGLSADQIDFLPDLKVGQAVIHSEQLEEACLVKVDPKEDELFARHKGATAREKNAAVEGVLKSQMAEFRKNHGNNFRRFPLCDIPGYPKCDAPCQYQPLSNEPTGSTLRAANNYISALMYGDYNLVRNSGYKLRKEVEANLVDLYGEGVKPGYRHCALVQLADQSVQRLIHTHPKFSNWQSVLKLQSELILLWERLWLKDLPEKQKLEEVHKLILQKIAFEPRVSRPGCRRCKAPCRFGHRFQPGGAPAPAAQELAEQLRASRTETTRVEEIVDWAVKALGSSVRFDQHWNAGYCLLSQATANERLLSSYIEQAFSGDREEKPNQNGQ